MSPATNKNTVTANKNASKDLEEKLHRFIKKENASHHVVIWSKSYCPHCNKTKALFQSLPNAQVKNIQIHDLDVMENGSLLQFHLKNVTGSRTVPVVFVNNRYVGGNSDVQKLHQDGKLESVLQQSPLEMQDISTSKSGGECKLTTSMNKWTNEFLFLAESAVHRFD
jgi:glutaredoxin 3